VDGGGGTQTRMPRASCWHTPLSVLSPTVKVQTEPTCNLVQACKKGVPLSASPAPPLELGLLGLSSAANSGKGSNELIAATPKPSAIFKAVRLGTPDSRAAARRSNADATRPSETAITTPIEVILLVPTARL
jgi:hypothetical protein